MTDLYIIKDGLNLELKLVKTSFNHSQWTLGGINCLRINLNKRLKGVLRTEIQYQRSLNKALCVLQIYFRLSRS